MNTEILQRRVLREDVIDYFLKGILNKKYVPGDRVVEVQIALELGIGKGAVREAFRDLANMGFVTVKPYKGAFISNLSYKEMVDYYRVRLVLEKTALEWIFDSQESSGDAVIQHLSKFVEKMLEDCEAGDAFAQVKADMDFHRALIDLSKSDFLKKAWESLGHNFWFFFIHNKLDMDMKKQFEKHDHLYKALLAHEKTLALEYMDSHFAENVERLRES